MTKKKKTDEVFEKWFLSEFGTRPSKLTLRELGERVAKAKDALLKVEWQYQDILEYDAVILGARATWNHLTPPTLPKAKPFRRTK